jgi:hypothetical protein
MPMLRSPWEAEDNSTSCTGRMTIDKPYAYKNALKAKNNLEMLQKNENRTKLLLLATTGHIDTPTKYIPTEVATILSHPVVDARLIFSSISNENESHFWGTIALKVEEVIRFNLDLARSDLWSCSYDSFSAAACLASRVNTICLAWVNRYIEAHQEDIAVLPSTPMPTPENPPSIGYQPEGSILREYERQRQIRIRRRRLGLSEPE